jgi:uncharacterized membrane protein
MEYNLMQTPVAGRLNRIAWISLYVPLILALLIILAGLIMLLLQPPSTAATGPYAGIPGGLTCPEPLTLIALGIMLLLTAPAICILVSLAIFLLAAERLYIAMALIVLAFSVFAVITAII